MPDDVTFAEKIAPAIQGFSIESARFVINEGLPFLEMVLTHVIAPDKVTLRVEANVDVLTEGGGGAGIARIQITSSPRLRLELLDPGAGKEIKL